jgi:hypothetical protein
MVGVQPDARGEATPSVEAISLAGGLRRRANQPVWCVTPRGGDTSPLERGAGADPPVLIT